MSLYKRIDTLREKLTERGLEGIILSTNAAMIYLLDADDIWFQRSRDNEIPVMVKMGLPDRPYALNKADAVLYVPNSENSLEPCIVTIPQRQKDFVGRGLTVYTDYMNCFHFHLRKYIKGNGKYGTGRPCAAYLKELVLETDPEAEVVMAEEIINEMRAVKDENEINIMRRLCALSDELLQDIIDHIHVGETSMDSIQQYMADLAKSRNMADIYPHAIVFLKRGQSWRKFRDVNAYYTPDRVLEEDTTVTFDVGFMLRQYCSDYGRSGFCGTPTPQIENCYKALQAGTKAAIDSVVPWKTNIKDLFGTVKETAEKMGFGENLMNFGDIGLLGHQIGTEHHEHPWLHTEMDYVLRPGNIFAIEPKMMMEGECYLRTEDIVLVTETGTELLTKFDTNLLKIG